MPGDLRSELDESGYCVLPQVLPVERVQRLRAAAAAVFGAAARVRAGLRSVVERHPDLAVAAESDEVRALVRPVLGERAFLVRSILFDKNPAANWDVVWHQDKTIPVAAQRDAPGFGPWSTKDGAPHVQPPAAVLEGMLTVRLHLDDCDDSNGALLVVPGSHRAGILAENEIDAAAYGAAAELCPVPAGGAMLMRPLILHASRKSDSPTHRRVLHLEFAADPLPHGLAWGRG